MNCIYCGNSLTEGEKFCSRCGANVGTGSPVAPVQPQSQYNYASPVNDGKEVPMTVGQYVGTYIVCTFFGLISLILCIVWAFSNDSSVSKKNFCRALLIVQLIAIGLGILVAILMFAIIGSSLGEIIQNPNSWQYYAS